MREAVALHGRPEIFNTDQGSQFTDCDFVTLIRDELGVELSMDGKGCWRDNVFIERFWRSLKHEEVYLRAYASGSEARISIGRSLYAHAGCVFLRQSAIGWEPGTLRHLFPSDAVVQQLLKSEHPTAKLDERAWSELRAPAGAARPLLAVPMGSSKVAVALYEAHEDGRDIDPDEIRVLQDLLRSRLCHTNYAVAIGCWWMTSRKML